MAACFLNGNQSNSPNILLPTALPPLQYGQAPNAVWGPSGRPASTLPLAGRLHFHHHVSAYAAFSAQCSLWSTQIPKVGNLS